MERFSFTYFLTVSNTVKLFVQPSLQLIEFWSH
jgi:hypothetical protein